MKKTFERGFTLIELLVVIAIIGILAAVVIGSLGDARQSGQDASIKQSMSGIRSQAEISYNNSSFVYEQVCEDTNVTQALSAIDDAASEATAVNVTDSAASTATNVTCHDSNTGWAVIAPLNSSTDSWCVDSEGFAGEVAAGALAANEVACN